MCSGHRFDGFRHLQAAASHQAQGEGTHRRAYTDVGLNALGISLSGNT